MDFSVGISVGAGISADYCVPVDIQVCIVVGVAVDVGSVCLNVGVRVHVYR